MLSLATKQFCRAAVRCKRVTWTSDAVSKSRSKTTLRHDLRLLLLAFTTHSPSLVRLALQCCNQINTNSLQRVASCTRGDLASTASWVTARKNECQNRVPSVLSKKLHSNKCRRVNITVLHYRVRNYKAIVLHCINTTQLTARSTRGAGVSSAN